jgi:pyridoxine kinase
MTEAVSTVVTISSHVAAGPVGNSIIVPALVALAIEPVAIPTVILSNHPGHGSAEGMDVPADIITAMMSRAAELALLPSPAVYLTGYFRHPSQIEAVGRFIANEKRAGRCRYFLCDPVLGDEHTGLSVKPGIAEAIRDVLVPLADGITPNAFELGWLTNTPVRDSQSASLAARQLSGRDVVVTSVPDGDDRILTQAYLEGVPVTIARPRLTAVPHGTGDLFAGVLAAGITKGIRPAAGIGFAVAAVERVISRSAGPAILDLAHGLSGIADVQPCEVLSNARS